MSFPFKIYYSCINSDHVHVLFQKRNNNNCKRNIKILVQVSNQLYVWKYLAYVGHKKLGRNEVFRLYKIEWAVNQEADSRP